MTGSYSYVDGEGKQRSVSYKAGADIGFVPLEVKGFHPDIMASFAGFGKRQTAATSFSLNPRSTIPHRNHVTSSSRTVGTSSSSTLDIRNSYAAPKQLAVR